MIADLGFFGQAQHKAPGWESGHTSLSTTLRLILRYYNVAFEFSDSRAIQLAFEGRVPAHAYSRISNPAVEELERRVRLLADA